MSHMPQTAANSFYTVAELRHILLDALPFIDLVNISHVDGVTRSNVMEIFKARVRGSLHPWFAPDQIPETLQLMRSTSSAFAGVLPLVLMDVPLPTVSPSTPSRLDIVTPNKYRAEWFSHLSLNGFEYQSPEEIPVPAIAGRHEKKFHHAKSNVDIVLHVSDANDIISAVVHMPTTLHMNILTASAIYSFYPNLTRHLRVIEGPWKGWFESPMELWNNLSRTSTAAMGSPCHVACPNMWRRTYGLRHVGQFQWDGDCDANVEMTTHEGTMYMWRLGEVCVNQYCVRSFLVR